MQQQSTTQNYTDQTTLTTQFNLIRSLLPFLENFSSFYWFWIGWISTNLGRDITRSSFLVPITYLSSTIVRQHLDSRMCWNYYLLPSGVSPVLPLSDQNNFLYIIFVSDKFVQNQSHSHHTQLFIKFNDNKQMKADK